MLTQSHVHNVIVLCGNSRPIYLVTLVLFENLCYVFRLNGEHCEPSQLFFWCRTTAKCEGVASLPDGSKLDLTGKEFKDRRWAVVMTFDRATKKATMMEVLWDYAEVGRMMGCPSYALACATQELYPA